MNEISQGLSGSGRDDLALFVVKV